jgi:hypothetical protein
VDRRAGLDAVAKRKYPRRRLGEVHENSGTPSCYEVCTPPVSEPLLLIAVSRIVLT